MISKGLKDDGDWNGVEQQNVEGDDGEEEEEVPIAHLYKFIRSNNEIGPRLGTMTVG
jgi:hypothetical protein